ncbi:hypothetical protein E2C01_031800 [Portunus trituberculatus]|uniref:Uncharacterized protein n=1 Tax=Portunus trituberculatus TaxID=210409 RepID=A0A5B7F121_PORTR|nr:hypothetical protein [Portunus trituberculatus]
MKSRPLSMSHLNNVQPFATPLDTITQGRDPPNSTVRWDLWCREESIVKETSKERSSKRCCVLQRHILVTFLIESHVWLVSGCRERKEACHSEEAPLLSSLTLHSTRRRVVLVVI